MGLLFLLSGHAFDAAASGTQHTLTVTLTGNGTVSSAPAGIACGQTCQAQFGKGTQVVLTATPATGWRLRRWGSGCTGSSGNACHIAMPKDRTATVYFERISSGVPSASLRFDRADGPVSKTIVRKSGVPVTFAWTTQHLHAATTCRIHRRPNDDYRASASPVAAGTRIDTGMHAWSAGTKAFYLACSDGTRSADVSLTLVDAWNSMENVTRIAVGGDHTCALTAAGRVWCWGANDRGQLGDGSTTDRLAPTPVSGLTGVQAIAAGWNHTCALRSGGGVRCWGSNDFGQLGVADRIDHPLPVAVPGLGSGVQAVVAGWSHGCALTTAGAVRCWGGNDFGQLGDGSTTGRTSSTAVSGLGSGVQAIASAWNHVCALTTAGAVRCWGYNGRGQLGIGNTSNRTTPVTVVGLDGGMQAIATGRDHTCALSSTGALRCWGANTFGQLGEGGSADRRTPTAVQGLGSGVQAIGAGHYHSCALSSEAARCWGYNVLGQVGDGSTANRYAPVPVSTLGSGLHAIAGGRRHTCALTAVGELWCWGGNDSGQIGDGTLTMRPVPVPVVGVVE